MADDRITGIESTLPFAGVARHRPEHPSLALFRRFVTTEQRALDGRLVWAWSPTLLPRSA